MALARIQFNQSKILSRYGCRSSAICVGVSSAFEGVVLHEDNGNEPRGVLQVSMGVRSVEVEKVMMKLAWDRGRERVVYLYVHDEVHPP